MITETAKKFTLEEYSKLTEIGFFQEDDRVELIKGEIHQMEAKGTSHVVCGTKLYRELFKLIDNRAMIRYQDSVSLLSKTQPEPDLVIVKNQEDEYLSGHPTPETIILIIEIADNSLKYDQEIKLPLYAEAGIKYYWLFNLVEHQLENYSFPYQKVNGDYSYSKLEIYLPNQQINLPEFSQFKLNLTKVFP